MYNSWLDATKFLTGTSTVGSIAIPIILKHAGVIGWGAMALELSSFFVFVLSILCYLGLSEVDGYSMFWDWPWTASLLCLCATEYRASTLPLPLVMFCIVNRNIVDKLLAVISQNIFHTSCIWCLYLLQDRFIFLNWKFGCVINVPFVRRISWQF